MKLILISLITVLATTSFASPEDLDTVDQLKALVKGSMDYEFSDSSGLIEEEDALWIFSSHLLIDGLTRRNTCQQSQDDSSIEHCMLSLLKEDKSYGVVIRYVVEGEDKLVSINHSDMINAGKVLTLTFKKKK